MGRIIEKSGKNVNDAIAAALAELRLSIDDVHIDVLDEGKAGLFGLLSGKQAKVRVSELDEDERAPQPGYAGSARQSGSGGKAVQADSYGDARHEDEDEYAEDDGGYAEDEQEDAGYANAPAGEGPGAAADDGAEDDDDAYNQEPETGAGDYDYDVNRAINYLSDIFDGIHVDAGISAEATEEGFQLNVESEDSGILIGHRGETLDSIQYLLNLYMNKGRSAFIRVSVDVENYKMKREAALIRLAGQMAEKVVRLRRNFTLDAMNSYERRIVHSALQNHPKVETYSIGEEPNRKVVVTLKNRGGYSSR